MCRFLIILICVLFSNIVTFAQVKIIFVDSLSGALLSSIENVTFQCDKSKLIPTIQNDTFVINAICSEGLQVSIFKTGYTFKTTIIGASVQKLQIIKLEPLNITLNNVIVSYKSTYETTGKNTGLQFENKRGLKIVQLVPCVLKDSILSFKQISIKLRNKVLLTKNSANTKITLICFEVNGFGEVGKKIEITNSKVSALKNKSLVFNSIHSKNKIENQANIYLGIFYDTSKINNLEWCDLMYIKTKIDNKFKINNSAFLSDTWNSFNEVFDKEGFISMKIIIKYE